MMLDRSKPFSEAWGSAAFRYMQGGRFFNSAGEEVAEDGRPIAEAKQAARIQKKQAFEQDKTDDARPVYGDTKAKPKARRSTKDKTDDAPQQQDANADQLAAQLADVPGMEA